MAEPSEYKDNVVQLTTRLGNQPGEGGLLPPSDGGGSGGAMDVWKIGVDRQIGELRSEVAELRKWLTSAIAASFLLLAGGGFTYYVKLSDQFQSLSQQQAISVGDMKANDARLSGKLDLVIDKLSAKTAAEGQHLAR